jgi:hypothetical protein
LKDEIEIFNEVIALYNSNIQDQSDDLKERADDYIDNGEFDDDASYDPREVPNIDLLNGNESTE